MDIKHTYRILIFVVVAIALMAQAAPKTQKQLIEEAIQEKLNTFTNTVEKKCARDIQKRAAEIVDSLLIKEAQTKTVDTFTRPAKANKPPRPEVRIAKDTTLVKPLFGQ